MKRLKKKIEAKVEKKAKNIGKNIGKKLLKKLEGKISKNRSTINDGILEIVVESLSEIRSDCHETKIYGSLDKDELKYLQIKLENFLKYSNLANLILENFTNSEEKITLVGLQIRNALFSLLSQTKTTKAQGKYIIRKRLGFKKKSDIEKSMELDKIVEKAITSFSGYITFPKGELTEEIKKSSFNFNFSYQVQTLFEGIIHIYDNNNVDPKIGLLQEELISLLLRYQELNPRKVVYEELLELDINESHPLIKNIKDKYDSHKPSQLFPTLSEKSDLDLLEKPEKFPDTDILQKYIGNYFRDGKLIKNESDFRNVCHFKQGKYRCFLKFGMNQEEEIGILIEYTTFLFSSFLIGHGIPYSRLCRVDLNGKQILALAVSELKEKDYVQEKDIKKPETLNLDEEFFADFYFLTLILAPGDLRYGNCAFKTLKNGKRSFEIFDNEHNFQDGKDQSSFFRRFGIYTTGYRFVQPMTNVNNFILGLDCYMKLTVNQMAITKNLRHNLESLTKRWLEKLREELLKLSINEYPFTYQTIEKMLERMGLLRLILMEAERNGEKITYSQVLDDFQRALSASYQQNTSSSLRGKSTSARHIGEQGEKAFEEVQKKIGSIAIDDNRNELIPCYSEFNREKFNRLTSYAQAYYLQLANQYSNSDEYPKDKLDELQKIFSENLTKIKFERLYVFEIRGNQHLEPKQVATILKQIAEQKENLKKLSFRGCSINDAVLSEIVKLCNKLNVEILDLSNTKITKLSIRKEFALFQNPSKLRIIILSDCSQLTTISIIAPHLKRLKASNCHKLKHLKVESTTGIATANLHNCGFEDKFSEWCQAVQLDLQLAKYGCVEVSKHLLETIKILQYEPTFFYRDQGGKYYLAQTEQSIWDVLEIECKTLFVVLREHNYITNSSKNVKNIITREIKESLSKDDLVSKILMEKSLMEEWKKLEGKSADQQTLLSFCSRSEVHMQYFNYLDGKQILTFGLIHAYREMKDLDVAIWSLQDSEVEEDSAVDASRLRGLFNEFQDDQQKISERTIHLLYFDKSKNFTVLAPCRFLNLDKKFYEKDADLRFLFDIIGSNNRYAINRLTIDLSFVKELQVSDQRALINAIKSNNSVEDFYILEKSGAVLVNKVELLKKLRTYLPVESDTNTSSSDSVDVSAAIPSKPKTKVDPEQTNEPRIQRHATVTEPGQWENRKEDQNEEKKSENKISQLNKEVEELKSELEKTKKERDAEKKEKEALGQVVQKTNELSKQAIEIEKTISQNSSTSSNTDTVINTAAIIATAIGGPGLGGPVWTGAKVAQAVTEAIMGTDEIKNEGIKKVEEIHKMTAEVLQSTTKTESESTSTTPTAMKP